MSGGGAVEQEAAYYQAVEEFFVARRGDPLLLSNADWTLVRAWRQAGIPLRVVLRGIADALDAHAHSFSRDRKVGSLRYCRAEVENAHERWRRALAGAGEEVDVEAAVEALADACEAASREAAPDAVADVVADAAVRRAALGPRSRRRAAEISAELRRRARSASARLDLEPWLAATEAELVRLVRREAGVAEVAAVEAEVDADLAPYRERLPERVLKQVRGDSIARRLLEDRGLPRLTLFQV